MVAPINSHCVVHADLNQYTLMPRLDGVDLNFEYAYDADGSLRVIAEYPRAADITGDYVLDAGDLSAFTDAFNNNEPAGDFNGDGVYDQADLTGFVNAFSAGPSTYYNAGCPAPEPAVPRSGSAGSWRPVRMGAAVVGSRKGGVGGTNALHPRADGGIVHGAD